ncbi:MAG: hypothetical protein MZV65_45285 [Chromatiales bacterium]|nr:hypothetical protein [Chromatiales bacterium]
MGFNVDKRYWQKPVDMKWGFPENHYLPAISHFSKKLIVSVQPNKQMVYFKPHETFLIILSVSNTGAMFPAVIFRQGIIIEGFHFNDGCIQQGNQFFSGSA